MRTAKGTKTYAKGTPVTIVNHHGCRGSTGRVSSKPQRINGRTYWNVRMTGGRGRGWTLRFLASEMERS